MWCGGGVGSVAGDGICGEVWVTAEYWCGGVCGWRVVRGVTEVVLLTV